ncbi:cell division cycle 5-like protein [Phoenix dactylifera]|uniref:Cell division cycle 5-like protein n=1 Tax=Phoenix dactylifera TaxID=42345 RepID=A0A8B7CLJ2_PHODC|nr:cell division cycle 5-like protein [Phoenix dactylifera]XP_008801723.2 cell division cycle 5-like protein [Phoenix dactylifera]
MRIMIKGGVWKNTEDEILKAAVMKYGKNQWARISSLLVRKSAKQCKARWYEWLDPSIKKTEWTREEDEKLLHLAKLMPTQWRTIAPIVGRTPSQCLERYEKLLDAACAKDENYEPSDDPRKLRPGEIDPNPESKPARPDPVDMDEDEKEMLSEARARLANTRGKKAKRKAREKQLEEARRLASLQKRRELKAAGIDTRKRKRKRKGIDYNAEIPFEKRPLPGFYDVSGEERPVEQPKFPTTIEELEGKRRVDIEAQLRKQDIARNKIAQRQDAPASILQANKLNDPEAVRKRSKLMLPAPQISDQELEEIAKMGYANDFVLSNEELTEGSGATRALLANYSQTPRQGMTPLRTPQRTPAGKGDAIMMEAENLARLRESQTPLFGGENPELHPSDFSGVTPRKREIQTPNPVATPLATPGAMSLTPRIGMTPSRDAYSFGATPKVTPFRDELHINEDMEMQDSAKLELRRQAELKKTLRSGLTNLPQPKNEYQIVSQPIPEENEETEEKIEEDMSDRIAREKAQEQARKEALLRKRSKVLQRELPRPPAASLEHIKNSLMRGDEDKSSFVPPTLFEQADEMISKELLALLEYDNAKYPLDGKQEKEKKKYAKHVANGKAMPLPEIEDFDEDELKEANSLIKEEVEFLRVAMGHENESFDDFVKAHDACQEDLMYFPARDSYGLASIAGNSEKLAALQNEFEIMKRRMDDEAKKATRLEQKVKLLTQGYQTRAGKLWSQIEATYKQMDTAATELECFKALQKQEHLAASYRVSGLIEEVNKQKVLEQSLQQQYGDLLTEHDRIQKLLEEHKAQLRIQEEIAAKNRALEEELAARNRALEEEAAAKHGTLDEKLAEENQHVDTAQLRDVCRPDSGLDQTDLPNADHTETSSSCKQPIPSIPSSRLFADGSSERKDAFEGQSTQSANVIQEGLSDSKHTYVVDKNAELSGGVAGFVNEEKEMVGHMIDAPAPVQNQIDGLREQETTVAHSGSEVAGAPVIQPTISQQTRDPSASSDSAVQMTACLSDQITVSCSTGLENMVVDSGDGVVDGELVGCSNISTQAVVPVESGNADTRSADQIAGDSSNQAAAASALCSEEKIHSDFSIRTAVNSADYTLNSTDGGIVSETNVSIPDCGENSMVKSDDKAETGDGK